MVTAAAVMVLRISIRNGIFKVGIMSPCWLR